MATEQDFLFLVVFAPALVVLRAYERFPEIGGRSTAA
jgi:hypothetical protein